MEKSELVRTIVSKEWEMFQQTQNIGGRASCQDDRTTFNIMRASQFFALPEKFCESYLEDIVAAERNGRNLVTEKYAYMMKSTNPKYYAEVLQPHLPKCTAEKLQMIDEISRITEKWENEFHDSFPLVASACRPVASVSDGSGFVSVETYLRGELKTYSNQTVKKYWEYAKACEQNGVNIVAETITHTAKCYGFQSLAEMEERLQKSR